MRSLFHKILTFTVLAWLATPLSRADELESVRETLEDARRQLRELEIEGFNRAEALLRLGSAIDALKVEVVEDESVESQPIFERLSDDIAYARIDETTEALAAKVGEELSGRESWSGLILDLRFADKGDWDGVNQFLRLISAGSSPEYWVNGERYSIDSESEGLEPRAPALLLINRETRGAPWGLAAIAQAHTLGMIIGEAADRGESASGLSAQQGAATPDRVTPDVEVVVDLDIQRRLRKAGPSSWLRESTPSMRNIILDQLTQGAGREDAAVTGLEIDAPVARAMDLIKAVNIARRRDAER